MRPPPEFDGPPPPKAPWWPRRRWRRIVKELRWRARVYVWAWRSARDRIRFELHRRNCRPTPADRYYGLHGCGICDDTLALQVVVDDAHRTGRPVRLTGNYRVRPPGVLLPAGWQGEASNLGTLVLDAGGGMRHEGNDGIRIG